METSLCRILMTHLLFEKSYFTVGKGGGGRREVGTDKQGKERGGRERER